MEPIVKTFELLFKKQWIITLISFVETAFISIAIPNDLYQKFVFDEKTNIILGYCVIYILIFLVNYFIFLFFNKLVNKYKVEQEKIKYEEKISSEIIEDWKTFFDEISDEDYSVLMFFIKTNNTRIYKDWRDGKNICSDQLSIFTVKNMQTIFHITKTNEDSSYVEVIEFPTGKKKKVKAFGQAWNFKMKDDFYRFLKYIYERDGMIGHFERSIYKLPYENGNDLIDFQNESPKKEGFPFPFNRRVEEE